MSRLTDRQRSIEAFGAALLGSRNADPTTWAASDLALLEDDVRNDFNDAMERSMKGAHKWTTTKEGAYRVATNEYGAIARAQAARSGLSVEHVKRITPPLTVYQRMFWRAVGKRHGTYDEFGGYAEASTAYLVMRLDAKNRAIRTARRMSAGRKMSPKIRGMVAGQVSAARRIAKILRERGEAAVTFGSRSEGFGAGEEFGGANAVFYANQGAAAEAANKPGSANPYKRGSWQHRAWREGWEGSQADWFARLERNVAAMTEEAKVSREAFGGTPRKHTIYWRASGGKAGRRSGTIMPQRGEDWPAMLRFLRMTGATDVFAHYYDSRGHLKTVHDGK
jgi:hypothetical protein